MKKKVKLGLILVLACLVLVSLSACGGQEVEIERQLVEVTRGDLMLSVSADGNLSFPRYRKLAFNTSGTVAKVNVEEGNRVTEGQVLAKLDTGALALALTQTQAAMAQARLARAQAQLALEEAEHNLNLLKPGFASSSDKIKIAELQVWVAEAQLEAAEVQIGAAEQALKEAQKDLEEATITAPFNGIIVSVYVKEGDIIPSPTMAPQIIVHVIDPATMELKAEVDEIDIPSVRLWQQAIISVDALPDLELEGRVTSIYPLPSEESGLILYKVRIDFDVAEGSGLKAGMSATADIIISKQSNVLLLPNRAIEQDSLGNPMVKVMVNEQIEERPVVIGISDGYQTEIVAGLNEGEVVVVERKVKPETGGGLFGG